MALTDQSPMPFGVHKGTDMEDVPASYLIYLHENKKTNPEVQEYIDDNMNVLLQEVKGR
jgi:uncharacterized protein (DUF3820 family)